MIGLALDFAGPQGQVGIASPAETLYRAERPAGPGTVEGIVPFALNAIEKAGLTVGQIDIVVATTGPGSFTGIRAGLAAAHGLALSHDRPIFGRTVFDAIALSFAPAQYPALIALDGRRSDLFVQLRIDGAANHGAPTNLSSDKLNELCPAGPVFVAGSAADVAVTALRAAGRPTESLEILEDCRKVDIGLLAQLAASGPNIGHDGPLEPFYGRAPDARPQR